MGNLEAYGFVRYIRFLVLILDFSRMKILISFCFGKTSIYTSI